MSDVDELARVRAEIRRLKAREKTLRERLIAPGAILRSNSHEVQIKTQRRRVFLQDHLPAEVLEDPLFWESRETQVVTVLPLDPEADFDLIEPF